MSNILSDANSSSIFWIGLAIILIVSVAGYIVARRAGSDPAVTSETAKIVQDWIPTGRIDFAGPSIDESASDVPAAFFLQAEEIRLLISLSGIERKEIRWRKATLNEAKRVVNIFHRQLEKKVDAAAEIAPTAAVSAAEDAKDIAKGEG